METKKKPVPLTKAKIDQVRDILQKNADILRACANKAQENVFNFNPDKPITDKITPESNIDDILQAIILILTTDVNFIKNGFGDYAKVIANNIIQKLLQRLPRQVLEALMNM